MRATRRKNEPEPATPGWWPEITSQEWSAFLALAPKIGGPAPRRAYLPRIIVAEDDAGTRELIAWSLRARGYGVTECRDGFELLDRLGSCFFGERKFDLVVSDVRIPGLNGLQVLEGTAGMGLPPTILIAGTRDPEIDDRARRSGAVAVLQLPFDIDLLLEKVDAVLTNQPQWVGS